MGTLYIGVDFFYPGQYRPQTPVPGAETYAAEKDVAYLILQPAITTDPNMEPIAADTYFDVKAVDLGPTHQVKFIDTAALGSSMSSAKALPVPLPPLTRLDLNLQWDHTLGQVAIQRELPARRFAGQALDSPLLLEVGRWPDFAVANFARPPILSYKYLKADAAAAVLSWGVGLVPRILKRVHDFPHDDPDPLTAAEQSAYDLLRELAQQLQDPDKPWTEAQIRAYLLAQQGGVARIATLWERMLKADAGTGKHAIQPPRFLHDTDTLGLDPVGLLSLARDNQPAPIAVSYLNKLWDDLGDKLHGDQASHNAAVSAIQRLFGFGERLRWPVPVANDGFMVPDPTPARTPGWSGTNAHSLLGLVFRLPVNIGSGARPTQLTVAVAGASSTNLAQPLSLLLDRIEANPASAFAVTLARDADRPNGYFLYSPKMSEAPPVAGVDAGKAYYAAPPALLDAVDRNARWSSPVGADRLLVRKPPRTALSQAELYRPDALGAANVERRLVHKVRILRFPLSATSTYVYRVILGSDIHPDEAAELTRRFAALGHGSAELWITLSKEAGGGVKSWPLAGTVLDTVDDLQTGLFATIADHDDEATSLRSLLAKAARPDGGKADGAAADGYLVDLVLSSGAPADQLFNMVVRLPTDVTAPLCMLNGTFTSRISASTDRLLERFEFTLAPSPFPQVADQPVLDHFSNFNKLRVALSSDDPAVKQRTEHPTRDNPTQPDGRVITWLTYPDAAVPMDSNNYTPGAMPWTVAAPPGATSRHFGYFISHIFTQDSRADEAASDKALNAAEALRYVNYLTPHIPWRMEGYVEHQYSYRIPFSSLDIRLPLATDISNAAAAAKSDGTEAETVPLVQWSLTDAAAAGGGERILLRFSRRFLKLALAADGAAPTRPARLRAVYEPLADLIAAVDRGTASLDLERWVFDADLISQLNIQDRTSIIRDSLRRAAHYLYKLTPSVPELQGLDEVRRLLGLPLTALEQELTRLSGLAGDNWLELSIPFSTSWTPTGDPLEGSLAASSDALRLGLRLSRADDSVVSPYLLPANPANAPAFGIPVDKDQVISYPALKDERFEPLLVNAARELADYLSNTADTPLRDSFAWLRTQPQTLAAPAGPPPTDPEEVFDPKRLSRLFGEVAPYLFIPLGERPVVKRVVDLFYVPIAFRPLAAHPQIGDPATSLEFAEFLLQTLDDLFNGRKPSLVGVTTHTPVADAYTVYTRLRKELLPIVVAQLTALITYVHNDADPTLQQDKLFGYVDGLTKALMNDSHGALSACTELLTSAPGLFATSKAFALGIFEADAWSDRLYAIQLRKDIHGAGSPLVVPTHKPAFDREQITFDRFRLLGNQHYFVDVLDDGRYDNEFQIAESRFDPPRAPFTGNKPAPVLLDRQALKERGATEARSGEDVIEQRNGFTDDPTAARQIESDTVHWNRRWRTEPDASGAQKRFYLLPSRRYPDTPTVLKPKNLGTDDPPWRSWLHLTLATPNEKPDLNVKIMELLKSIHDAQGEVRFPGTAGEDLIASRIDPGSLFAFADPHNTHGWWHVESYATAHYFLVQPDEDTDQDDVILANDRFAIEVELHDSPPAEEPVDTAATPQLQDGVGRWFQYTRQLQSHAAATAPTDLDLAELETELRNWLQPATGQPTSVLLRPYAAPPAGAKSTDFLSTVSRFTLHPGRLDEIGSTNQANSIGSVLTAEIMQLSDSSKQKLPRYVLRVMVLDEPWSYTRVRVRVERNFTSIAEDAVPEINPAFQMVGKWSAWSSHGREPASIAFETLLGRNLPASLVRMQPMGVTAEKYLRAPSNSLVSYGDLLGAALGTSFLDSTGQVQSFWNLPRARSKKLQVGGLILQKRPDLHPRYGVRDVQDQPEARTELIPRQYLPTGVPASAATELFGGISRAMVPTLHQMARVVWSNAQGERMLDCTWPILFSRE
jgi:hypothetical protein